MKNIFESEEVFMAFAEIDLLNLALDKLITENINNSSGIEFIIDKATGFDVAKKMELCSEIIEICEMIIERKKIVNADFSINVEIIRRVNNFLIKMNRDAK